MPWKRHVLTGVAIATCVLVPALRAGATDLGIGFGGYAMTDQEPLTAATFSFNTDPALATVSFSLRTGESTTNVLVAGKVIIPAKRTETTMIGLGASLAFLTTPGDDPFGIGVGGGVQTFVSERVALVADLYPLSFQFNGGTRIGVFSSGASGALGVIYYFSEM
jgi:hypothetical protein